jgi:hypothetical protein
MAMVHNALFALPLRNHTLFLTVSGIIRHEICMSTQFEDQLKATACRSQSWVARISRSPSQSGFLGVGDVLEHLSPASSSPRIPSADSLQQGRSKALQTYPTYRYRRTVSRGPEYVSRGGSTLFYTNWKVNPRFKAQILEQEK